VLAGRQGWLYDRITAEARDGAIEGRVVLPGYIPAEDLPALLSGALAFLFPSLYEGFGLPVLEAMACGAPVICSAVSSLPETAGDAALLVDPTDVNALAAALTRVLIEPSLAADLRARGFAQAARFNWERTAAETLSIYRQASA